MIPANNLTITIVNTAVNNMPLDEEFAQKGTLELKWNGGDDRHQYMMPSELNFSMEVIDAQDLAFKHLFTGNEKQYQVVITNENSDVIWRGHLLPEQYEEPYEHKILYVNFTATDGLARLKGKQLPGELYKGRHSVITIINECLKQTNLELPLYFAPAIRNDFAAVGTNYTKIFVDGGTYLGTSDKPDDCYKILEGLLETLGCSLFTYQDKWFITAHNAYEFDAFSSNFIQYYVYDDGVFTGFEDMFINPDVVNFEATPQVSLLPPLKKVTVNWPVDEPENILPDDIIQQPYETNLQWQNPPPIKYWSRSQGYMGLRQEPLGERRLPDNISVWSAGNLSLSDDEVARRRNMVSSEQYVVMTQNGIVVQDNRSHYMELAQPVYLKSVPDYISFSITLVGIFNFIDNSGPFPTLDETLYGNDNLNYAILYDGQMIISNHPDYINRDAYLLDINFEGGSVNNAANPKRIVGSLSIEDLQLPYPGGELQLRIYSGAGGNINNNNIYIDTVGMRNLRIIYTADKEQVTTVTRDIDWTTEIEIDAIHGGNVNDLSISHFTLDATDTTVTSYTEYTPIGSKELPRGYVPPYSTDQYIEVSQSDYNALQTAVNNGKELYGIINGTFNYTQIKTSYPVGFPMFRTVGNKYYVYLEYVDGRMFNYYILFAQLVKDQLFVYNQTTAQNTVPREYRELWSRSYIDTLNENKRYTAVRAQLVHDTQPAALVKIDASVFGLLDPWTMLQYDIDGVKRFITTDLSLQLDEGMSQVTMVENIYQPDVETTTTIINEE